jgi:hypothetical protein
MSGKLQATAQAEVRIRINLDSVYGAKEWACEDILKDAKRCAQEFLQTALGNKGGKVAIIGTPRITISLTEGGQ